MRKLIQEMSEEDQKLILDLEQRILNIKRDLIDADKADSENLKQEIDDIKQQITDIKDRAKEDDLAKKEKSILKKNFKMIEQKLEELSKINDLAEWNKVQMEIWLEIVKSLKLDKNDFDKFAKFGAFFNSYWLKKKKIPSVSEILEIF